MQSRSTWACELKCIPATNSHNLSRHAPRERVSWNPVWAITWHCVSTSRSTWACELKWKICTQSFKTLRSRSTWACELKWSTGLAGDSHKSHAPRERVSWNWLSAMTLGTFRVTLHVSVWVEITAPDILTDSWESRSTWACELKWQR